MGHHYIAGASHLKNNYIFIEQAERRQSNEHTHRSLSIGIKLYFMKPVHNMPYEVLQCQL